MNEATEERVKVFVSRKEKDSAIVSRIIKRLEIPAGDSVRFFTSTEIISGESWRNQILDNLVAADVLFLIYTDPTMGWDWCLYEVGLFTPLDRESERPIVCLHPAGQQPPAPLQHIQAVPAEQERVAQFLADFFGTAKIVKAEPVIHARFAENREAIQDLAKKICLDFENARSAPPANILKYNREFSITLSKEDVKSKNISGFSPILIDRMTLEVFGYLDKPANVSEWTWDLLMEPMMEAGDDAWIEPLKERLIAACDGRDIRPMRKTVTSRTSRKTYCPNVSRRELNEDGSVTLRIVLIQQPTDDLPVDVTHPAPEK